MFFWTLITHNFTLNFSKLSLLVQFLRVFPGGKTAKACLGGITLVICNAAVNLALIIFHCEPVPVFWNDLNNGNCLPYSTLFYPSGVGNLITSLVVFIVPMPKISSLCLPHKVKIGLFIIFVVGSL